MKSLKCTVKGCNYRHPKTCKWFSKEVGCRRNYCEFLHGTLAKSDDKITAHKESSLNVKVAEAHLKVKNMWSSTLSKARRCSSV